MPTRKDFFRIAVLGSVLIAGSCAAPTNDANGGFADGAVNHPIMVEPSYLSLNLNYSPADNGLSSRDAARLETFVNDYNQHGNGSIAVSAPDTPSARNMIAYFAERIAQLGVPRDHILVATHDAPNGDMRVEINYVAYRAGTDKCGDWSENLAFTADNDVPKNFGCAVQHNIAAMVSDPRDLVSPRAMGEVDTARRAAVVDHYEKGEITQADKRTDDKPVEQSAPRSSGSQ